MTDTNQNRVQRAGLDVDETLATFLETSALPGTGVDADTFWDGLAGLIADMGQRTLRFWPSAQTSKRSLTPTILSAAAPIMMRKPISNF
jgi:malate synthase